MKISLEQRVRAAGGPLAYMRRLRRIEDLLAGLDGQLDALERDVVAELGARGPAVDAEVERRARDAVDLRVLNELIDRHNRYYPIEADLPMDPKTGTLLDAGEPWVPIEEVRLDRVLSRWRERVR